MNIRELREHAQRMELEQFSEVLGPIVLVQAPTTDELKRLAASLGNRGTLMAEEARSDGFKQTANFDELIVKRLPKLKSRDVLKVGRMETMQIQIEDPTVSKHHASVHWDAGHDRFTVIDQRSRNGTFLNGAQVTQTRLGLDNGDLISFGSAHFLFYRTEALWAKLRGKEDVSFVIERR